MSDPRDTIRTVMADFYCRERARAEKCIERIHAVVTDEHSDTEQVAAVIDLLIQHYSRADEKVRNI